MTNYSEQQIEENLRHLAAMQPEQNSVDRVNRQLRTYLGETDPRSARSLIYYAASTAAVLLINIGLLYQFKPAKTPLTAYPPSAAPSLTLANLNAAFETGGQQGLDAYFDKVESHRQPRAETITLQQLLNDI